MTSRSDISDTEPIDRNAPTERSVSAGTEPDPRRRTPGARTERQLGRFVLLESLGVGGMGVVLAAYDPELDRNVALKLLHPGPVDDLEGPAKLMREAQAMARLAHPNVVTVYEVGFARDQPFVAMELIDGTTLSVWLAQPRTWRAIIAMFTDAGRGLAAAHAAGLVHRDVKPSNVFVGRDGRARIGDFGLVTARDERGAIAGTPAYMAPEQLDGDADARADQFGFCVALWEALFGARPFGGTTFDEQRRAHRAGPPPVPRGTEVPARIAAAVRRGLAIAPADRWPDMPALLAALAYDPAIARRRLALGGAFAGLAALATWGALRTRATDPCAGSAAQLASAWDAGRQEAVRAAFEKTGLPYAATTWQRVEHSLGRYTGQWVDMRGEACRATRVDGRQSDSLMDLRMACLDRARDRLAALTTRWAAGVDATALERATAALDGLTPLATCADAVALTARAPLPSDPEIARAIAATRARLDGAAAMLGVGNGAAARTETAAARADADRTGWPQVQAEAALLEGRILSTLEAPGAEPAFLAAARFAGAAHDDRLAADALVRLVETLANDQVAGARALDIAAIVDVLIARASDASDLRANLAAARGDALLALARYDDARAAMLAARRDLLAADADSHDVVAVTGALATVAKDTGDLALARSLGEEALAAEIRLDGPAHPRVASILNNLAIAAEDAGDLPQARAYLERALAIKERAFGPDTLVVAMSVNNLGNVAAEQGKLDEADRLYTRALAIREHELGVAHPLVATSLGNLATVRRRQGKLDDALALAYRSRDIKLAAFGPEHPSVAYAFDAIAHILADRGDVPGARAAFERKLAINTKALGAEHPKTLDTVLGLGELLASANDCRGAEPYFARAAAGLATAAPDSLDRAEALADLGQCRVAAGKASEAEADLRTAIAIADKAEAGLAKRGAMRAVLAAAQWAAGERAAAIATAETGVTQLVDAGAEGASDLAELRAWLTKHRPPR